MDKRDNVKRRLSAGSSGKKDLPSAVLQSEEIKGSIEGLALEKSSQGKELSELVAELQKETGFGRDRVIRRIMQMKDAGKIRVSESHPYSSLLSYIFSPQSLWFWGAALATIASLLLIFVSSGLAIYLRYVFGGLLVLFLPGYALVELLYSKKQELEELTRIALSIGLSLAIVPLTGLVLNYTPLGIRLYPVVGSLALLTIIFLVGAVRRKHVYYKLLNDVP